MHKHIRTLIWEGAPALGSWAISMASPGLLNVMDVIMSPPPPTYQLHAQGGDLLYLPFKGSGPCFLPLPSPYFPFRHSPSCPPRPCHPGLLSFLRIGQATDLTLSCPRTLALATGTTWNILLWALHLAGSSSSFLREAFHEYTFQEGPSHYSPSHARFT